MKRKMTQRFLHSHLCAKTAWIKQVAAYPPQPGTRWNSHSSALIVKNDAAVVPSSAAAARPSWPCFCARMG